MKKLLEVDMSQFTRSIAGWSRRSKQFVALLVVGIPLLSIIAYAVIPDSNGVIHGCYKTSNGSLRVIDSPAVQCDPRNETAISWSQTGPQGPQGEPGPQGPQGPIGPQGPGGTAVRLITIGTGYTGFPELMPSCSDPIRSKEFVKQSASSTLRITYHDRAVVNFNYTGAVFVDVLIDGAAASPTQIDYLVDNGGDFTAFGYANGISAGAHTLTSRYSFGGSSSPPSTCFQAGGYTIEIEEIEL